MCSDNVAGTCYVTCLYTACPQVTCQFTLAFTLLLLSLFQEYALPSGRTENTGEDSVKLKKLSRAVAESWG